MSVEVDAARAQVTVESSTPANIVVYGSEALKEWRDKYRIWVEGAQFSRQFKRGWWDGYWAPGEFLRPTSEGWMFKCGRGFLNKVLQHFDLSSHKLIQAPKLEPDNRPGLRDYQQEALELIFKHAWGRISLATNAGKGAIISLAASTVLRHGFNVLVLCDEISVFEALEQEMGVWTGDHPYRIQQGEKAAPRKGLAIGMLQTLGRRIGKDEKHLTAENVEWREYLETVHMVLVDEADKATADTYTRVLRAVPNTLWRVGFSGTFPKEGTQADLQLEEAFGPILIQVKNKELVERGISAKPTVHLHRYRFRLPFMDYKSWEALSPVERRLWVYQNVVFGNEERHLFMRTLLLPSDPNVIIVNRIEHGEQLLQYIPDSRFLFGEYTGAERNVVLDEFSAGKFQNLIVTKILDRGTNRLGKAVGLIFASAEGSERQTLQRIGRGLRRTDGKEFLHLCDIVDVPEVRGKKQRGAKYLEDLLKKRIDLYNTEGFDVRIHA